MSKRLWDDFWGRRGRRGYGCVGFEELGAVFWALDGRDGFGYL